MILKHIFANACCEMDFFAKKKMIPDYYKPVKFETYQLTSKAVTTISFSYHDYNKCCMFSFGLFSSVWSLITNVSEAFRHGGLGSSSSQFCD
jgi:hypothetical protein